MTDEGGPSGAPGDDAVDPDAGSGSDDADVSSGADDADVASTADEAAVDDQAGGNDEAGDGETADGGTPDHDPAALATELERLRDRVDDLAADRAETDDLAALREAIDELEDDVEDRTVHRDEIESDLKRYVRKRVRRGHARGWGPYLVLLYGTVMTLGVFYFFQNSAGYAIFAMIIIWLSTLGLYSLMLVVNGVLSLLSVPGRARDVLGTLRSLKP